MRNSASVSTFMSSVFLPVKSKAWMEYTQKNPESRSRIHILTDLYPQLSCLGCFLRKLIFLSYYQLDFFRLCAYNAHNAYKSGITLTQRKQYFYKRFLRYKANVFTWVQMCLNKNILTAIWCQSRPETAAEPWIHRKARHESWSSLLDSRSHDETTKGFNSLLSYHNLSSKLCKRLSQY